MYIDLISFDGMFDDVTGVDVTIKPEVVRIHSKHFVRTLQMQRHRPWSAWSGGRVLQREEHGNEEERLF